MRDKQLNDIINAWWWAERFESGNLPSLGRYPWRSPENPPKPGGKGSVVFIGVYNKTKLQQTIGTERFHHEQEYRDSNQLGYSVAVFLDHNLEYEDIDVPYATYLMYALRCGNLHILQDNRGFANFVSQMTQEVEQELQRVKGDAIIDHLMKLDERLSNKLGLSQEFEQRLGKIRGKWNFRFKPFLSASFFAEDLEKVAGAKNDDPLVAAYLRGSGHVEIDQDWESLIQAVSLHNLPMGKWPSPVEFGSSLMQQFAINTITGHLKLTDSQAYIRTVNGPPGTGKTTLLKDVFADMMVQQAKAMVALATPADGYAGQRALKVGNTYHNLYRLIPELTGYGIVVTSNNNSAVENISKDFPMIGEIQEHAKSGAEDDFQDRLNQVDFFGELAGKILSAKPDQVRDDVWGTFAVPMGSSAKISRALKYGRDLWSYLMHHSTSQHEWEKAVDEFNDQFNQVLQLKEEMADALDTNGSLERWMSLPNARKQLTVPYMVNPETDDGNELNQQLRQARARLFIAAMNVRKKFICYPVINRSGKKKFPVLEAYEIFDQRWRLTERKDVVDAFRLLQLLFPIVSSTLASFHSMFKDFDEDDLDYVFMDEAGQATPLSAVGALWRAKHFVALGDPAQIEPVVTTDASFLKFIGTELGVPFKDYLDPSLSVQRLADQANYFGHQDADQPWIGMPLWVHRRCLDPMFSISNRISYHGHMVMGLPASHQGWTSGWIDSRGPAKNKFVKDNADKLVAHIRQRLTAQPAIELDDIFVISPFSAVVQGIKKRLSREFGVERSWLNSHVGTVHTFQGKEAKVVYFVIGTDQGSDGAADWSCAQPNLINVAVTRAKKELYVIGDAERLKAKDNYREMYEIFNANGRPAMTMRRPFGA